MTINKSINRQGLSGLILVDKPKGITSFDVIRKLRKIIKIRKMGHVGTLDPNATGLLPICVGQATRLSKFYLHSDKTYEATIQLGWSTNTYDSEGEISGEKDFPPELSRLELEEHLKQFIGEIDQMPPIYSAIKIAGKPMYDYARRGENVEIKVRQVRIDDIEILEQQNDILRLRVACASGTYIRSLAHDLGKSLGCGAHLKDLVRTDIGLLSLDRAYSLEQMETMEAEEDFSFIAPMRGMFPAWPLIKLNEIQLQRITFGNFVTTQNPLLKNGELVRLVMGENDLSAIGVVKKPLGKIQVQIEPKIVFAK